MKTCKINLVKRKIEEGQTFVEEKLNKTMGPQYVHEKYAVISYYKGLSVAYNNMYEYVNSI